MGLDQRAEILVRHRALVLGEARPVETVGHRLVLQIALAALVADRAIQRVVDQQELHHPLARLPHRRRVGADHHVVADRHRAGGDRLGRALHLDQAHAAIAGDRQALVIAEARNLHPRLLAGLEDGDPVLDLDLNPVDGQCRHGSRSARELTPLGRLILVRVPIGFSRTPTAFLALRRRRRRSGRIPIRLVAAFFVDSIPVSAFFACLVSHHHLQGKTFTYR